MAFSSPSLRRRRVCRVRECVVALLEIWGWASELHLGYVVVVHFRGTVVAGRHCNLRIGLVDFGVESCGVLLFGTMLAQGLGRRLPALARLAQSSQGCSAALLDATNYAKEDRSSSTPLSRSWHFSRGRP